MQNFSASLHGWWTVSSVVGFLDLFWKLQCPKHSFNLWPVSENLQKLCNHLLILKYLPRFNYTYLCIYAKLVYIVDTITFTYIYILYTVQFKLTNNPCHDFSYQCCKSIWCITNKVKALPLFVCSLFIFVIQLSLFQLEQPFS